MLASHLALSSWLTFASASSPSYTCPGSPSWVHAYAKVDAVAQAPCEAVRAAMQSRIDGQPEQWHDPHNNGTYSVLDASDADTLQLQRRTGNDKYTDKLTFTFEKASASSCRLLGCSESQVTSVADFGTNYCNLRMLYCGSADGCKPVEHDFASSETHVATSSPGAQHDMKLCLRV